MPAGDGDRRATDVAELIADLVQGHAEEGDVEDESCHVDEDAEAEDVEGEWMRHFACLTNPHGHDGAHRGAISTFPQMRSNGRQLARSVDTGHHLFGKMPT